MSHKDAIPIYSTGISNLVTISAAGLAAATALLQIAGNGADNKGWYLSALIAFFSGLIFCFLSMAGLTGQATRDASNVNVTNIKIPVLAAFCLACVGFVLLGKGAFSSGKSTSSTGSIELVRKLENCRPIKEELRSNCYDAVFDSEIAKIELREQDIGALSDTDKAFLKMFIMRHKNDH